ncbi:hypothetical protein [Sphingobium sp. CR28]|uniref:hypothetical protein n=1 Tax=Sphingobium sp. CR28 TaxID=3400272 RepID=UPI003FEFCE17
MYNAGIAVTVALIASLGKSYGLPPIFRGDYGAFVKSAELMLSVGSSLLGFIIAAVTLIYALTAGQQFALLRASGSFSELAATSKAAMFWLLTASILGATLLLLEPSAFDHAPRIFIFLAAFVTAEVFVSTAALTWVISRLITLAE